MKKFAMVLVLVLAVSAAVGGAACMICNICHRPTYDCTCPRTDPDICSGCGSSADCNCQTDLRSVCTDCNKDVCECPPASNSAPADKGQGSDGDSIMKQMSAEPKRHGEDVKLKAGATTYNSYLSHKQTVGRLHVETDVVLLEWAFGETWGKVLYNNGNNVGWVHVKDFVFPQ